MSDEYGKSVRIIRENRNLSLSQLSDGIVSKSTLDKFELGDSSISFENLLPLLQRLRVSLSEFLYRVNEHSTSSVTQTLQKASRAYSRKDVLSLKRQLSELVNEKILEPKNLPFHRLDIIAVKAALGMLQNVPLPKEDVDFAMSYFLTQNEWFHYDLAILQFLPPFLASDILTQLVDTLFKNIPTFFHSMSNITLATNILIAVIGQLIMANAINDAEHLILRTRRESAIAAYLTTTLTLTEYEAIIQYRRGNQAKAAESHETLIAFLKILDMHDAMSSLDSLWDQLTTAAE